MDVYLYMFIVLYSPYFCLFGILIPALTTGIVYGIITVGTQLFRKRISQQTVKIVLLIVFALTVVVSCGYFVNYLGAHPPMLD